ncbi:MAG: Ca2+-dependent phosphoinositide-specific phospholipase C [Acholeplasma sp.]|nr:Ca2+-dependent phosphoinositide-specific phospholipase C [Acholeplasma sp.]
MIKKIIKGTLLIILALVIIFAGLVFYLSSGRRNSLKDHEKWLNELKNQDENTYLINEQEFYDFDLSATKFNEIQLLASHNSYKKKITGLGKTFVSLAAGKKEGEALLYENKTLTEQLNSGIRSFELDVRLRGNEFEITHVPLADNKSIAVSLKLAFEEIALFSNRNDSHIPIIIILEIKDDFMFLDPFLKSIGNEELSLLNDLVLEQFGDSLYKPSDVIRNNQTLNQTIKTNGWDSLNQMLGDVMVVVHAGKYAKLYDETFTDIKDANLFISGYKEDKDNDNVAFIIHNDLNVESIKSLVSENLIVRTRIDSELDFDKENFEKAVNSHAQILTSDFTVARKDLSGSEYIYLGKNKTTVKER